LNILTDRTYAGGNMFCVMRRHLFYLDYQQPWILMAEGMTGNRGWAPHHITLFGLIYAVLVIVAISVSLPYWRAIGVIQ